jgi:hypothetical protein
MITGVFRWFGMNVTVQPVIVTVVKLKIPEGGTCQLTFWPEQDAGPSAPVDPLEKLCAWATVADRVNATKTSVPFMAMLPRLMSCLVLLTWTG